MLMVVDGKRAKLVKPIRFKTFDGVWISWPKGIVVKVNEDRHIATYRNNTIPVFVGEYEYIKPPVLVAKKQ